MLAVRRFVIFTALSLCCWFPATAQETTSTQSQGVLADRIVALIDEAPVFASDLDVAEALGRIERNPGEDRETYQQRLLDQLIDERLRYAAVRRQGYDQLNLQEIDAQIQDLVQRFGGRDQLREALSDAGMDADLLREMVARQLVVWSFVDNRLGARVFVDLEDIEAYYENELTPQLEQANETVPPLREVREDIRELLYQRKLNEELDRWTADLRFQADISVYLDR